MSPSMTDEEIEAGRSQDVPKVTWLVSGRARIQIPRLLGTKAPALNRQGSFQLCRLSRLSLIPSELRTAGHIAGVQWLLAECMNLAVLNV